MSFEGNAAWKMPQSEPENKPKTRDERILELQHKQIYGENGSYTEEDRLELLRLREEKDLESGKLIMSKNQKEAYQKLFKKVREAGEMRQQQRLECLTRYGVDSEEFQEKFIKTIDPDGIYGLSEFEREEYRHLLMLVENGGLKKK